MSWLRLSLLSLIVTTGCAGRMAGRPAQEVASSPGEVVAAEPAPPPETAIAPPGMAVDPPAPPEHRPGLATQWGEAVWSPITSSPFVRASAHPWTTMVIHYNSEDGVRAHAAYLGGSLAPLEVPLGEGVLAVGLIGDAGQLLPGVATAGRHLVVGRDGERYRIVVRNATAARFEIVASVDGLDVIDGKPASPSRRGYIVNPHATLVIDGFRRTHEEVAAFRFGAVASSYAARTSGDANVGVIGLAVFSEQGATWTPAELGRRDQADPFPARSYAAPPPY